MSYAWTLGLVTACGDGGHDTVDAGPPPPDALVIGVEAIPLTTPDASYYNVALTFGGSQQFEMDLDTGSTSIAVAGTACTTCGVTKHYSPGTAATDMHKTARTEYADGSGWSGEIFGDMVGLGYETPPVPIDFVSISTQTQFFDGSSYEGIMGLGPKYLLEPGTTAYVPAATAAGATPIMAFELCATHGNMWLGGFDPAAGQGDVQYTTMLPIDGNNNPFYSIDIDDMLIGTASLGMTAPDFQQPIIDTGTSLAYLPTVVDTALLAKINADPGFVATFPGQTISENRCVSSAGVTAAQVDAALSPLVLKLPVAGSDDITISAPATSTYLYDNGGGTYCMAYFDGGNDGGATLGDSFIRGFLTVIDLQANRIGFAPDAGCAVTGDARFQIDRKTWKPRHPRPHPRASGSRTTGG